MGDTVHSSMDTDSPHRQDYASFSSMFQLTMQFTHNLLGMLQMKSMNKKNRYTNFYQFEIFAIKAAEKKRK